MVSVMTALTAAVVFALAAEWGQPVAPKTIVAEAMVESGLDPLAIHDNTTGRTFHPATVKEAMQISTQLDATGGNYDVGLMQINRRNFDWLHLTLANAFDPRHSIEAGAAIMVSMSRYNTGDLRGFENGYVEKVLATSRHLDRAPPETTRPVATTSAHAASFPPRIPPAPPQVALDMLHATEVPQNVSGRVVNLLGNLAPVRNVETAEQ
jgi:type IV secretion system protein VirB1